MSSLSNNYGDVIYSFTRADAISDGVLADVTSIAKRLGILIPVAITETVHTEFLTFKNCPYDADIVKQRLDLGDHRLHIEAFQVKATVALLNAMKAAINGFSGDTKAFEAECIYDRDDWPVAKGSYIAKVHGGDQGEPVMTIGKNHDF